MRFTNFKALKSVNLSNSTFNVPVIDEDGEAFAYCLSEEEADNIANLLNKAQASESKSKDSSEYKIRAKGGTARSVVYEFTVKASSLKGAEEKAYETLNAEGLRYARVEKVSRA